MSKHIRPTRSEPSPISNADAPAHANSLIAILLPGIALLAGRQFYCRKPVEDDSRGHQPVLYTLAGRARGRCWRDGGPLTPASLSIAIIVFYNVFMQAAIPIFVAVGFTTGASATSEC
jgi:hypothetical protein